MSLGYPIAVLAIPLFAYSLYRKDAEFPVALRGDAGRRRARKVAIAFAIFAVVDITITLVCFRPLPSWEHLQMIVPLWLGSGATVAFVLYKDQFGFYIKNRLKKARKEDD